MIAKASQEPAWVRRCRDLYYEPMIRLRTLEGRICATDSGMEWLGRVKQLPPAPHDARRRRPGPSSDSEGQSIREPSRCVRSM